ncbi:phage head closure protein [Magnetospirillum aberrantis]|uniref:Phage head closure protein n=1 Tax=Magnetospirillum aberrantis SpK TaxID=908842 RepID=A0A7C9QT65_9PROT|nr:phage head closure protein [Magnetospirillum aberrantis]NFV80000.1 phage head closure protein [Magnetospirillum aberrantis SpK]
MDAGKLDRLITILALTTGQDEYGGVTETWTPIDDPVWARWMPGAGSERFAAASTYAETQGRFLIRWRSDITPQHRVAWDGREFDILDVVEIGRREGLELRVKARA